MKGVVLAGGRGTRLYPLTRIVNKHLLPVGQHPMIFYSIKKLCEAGIKDILLVTGKESLGMFAAYLGSGKQWGVKITYRVQDEPGGIAQALVLAEDFIPPGEKFVALLGDNLFDAPLGPEIAAFCAQSKGARVLIKKVRDPERFGVPRFVNGKIIGIDEKPSLPKSKYAVTGIYFYDSTVFATINTLNASKRGELEITDVNNRYAQAEELSFGVLPGWWTDAGTIETLYAAGKAMLGR
ncbi:MAG TPA: sugar phosphate nucleotidyltransferase [Bacilli bacterium]